MLLKEVIVIINSHINKSKESFYNLDFIYLWVRYGFAYHSIAASENCWLKYITRVAQGSLVRLLSCIEGSAN